MKIYSFTVDNKRSAIEIEAQVDYDEVALKREPSSIKENNTFDIYKGKKAFDVLSYCDSINWVFSEKIKRTFEENKVTGIKFYPIKIKGIEANYYGYYIDGRAGKILNVDNLGVPSMFEPIEFNVDELDGSDVFCFENSGQRFMTEKVKKIFEENDTTNLRIKKEN